jgi:hypothetical protein
MDIDKKQLRLLSIFHYVVAGITALMACFPLIHLFVGLSILTQSNNFNHGGIPPQMDMILGWAFTIISSLMICLGWAFAICLLVAGNNLRKQSRYTLCLVVAAVCCVLFPFGTVLGVFTIIVLQRPTVKMLFER